MRCKLYQARKENAKKSPHAMRAWLEKVAWIRSP